MTAPMASPKSRSRGGVAFLAKDGKRPTDEDDAGGDGEHADGGAKRNVLIQCNRAENEHHDRGRPARNRIDDAELPARVSAGERNEVRELQRRRRGYERHRLRRNAARDHSRNGQQGDPEDQNARGRRPRIRDPASSTFHPAWRTAAPEGQGDSGQWHARASYAKLGPTRWFRVARLSGPRGSRPRQHAAPLAGPGVRRAGEGRGSSTPVSRTCSVRRSMRSA